MRKIDASPPTDSTRAPTANPVFTGVASFPDGAVGAPSITNTGDENTGFWFPAADTVALSTAGAERWRVDSNGDVGIGVADPLAPLHVKGVIRAERTDDASQYVTLFSSGAEGRLESAATVLTIQAGGTSIRFNTSGGSEKARIDSNGNLLLGVTAAGTTAAKALHMATGTAPTAQIAGGILWVEGTALKFMDSAGAVKTVTMA